MSFNYSDRKDTVNKTDRACGNDDCYVSSGICEEMTFGSGELDDNGYWEFPCRLCAKAYEEKNPDMAKEYGVWPAE